MSWTTKRPAYLSSLYVPPAWTEVTYNDDPAAHCICRGRDAAGRDQRLYSAEHKASAKDAKFGRVRCLLAEWADIRTQIESDVNDPSVGWKTKERAMIALLIYNTGMRPGTGADALAKVPSYGACTLQLRHIKPCTRGVRLKFIGKKGVPQNVLVTDPHLVRVLLARKAADPRWSQPVWRCGLNGYFASLGSGAYTPKDFRTAVGTGLALRLLGNRKRLPRAASKRRKVLNRALDRVARQLGNTRAVSRGSYVDPTILERFLAPKSN